MQKDTTPQSVRRTLLTGLLILLPLFVTYVLIGFLFNLFTDVSAPLMRGLFHLFDLDRYTWDPLVPFMNLLLSFAVIFLLGLFGTNILGRRILQAVDALILRLPLVKSVYGAVKQVVDTFQGPRRSFERVVLIEYPRKGTWTMGLVAAERLDTMNLAPSATLLTVYIPTTPNPTSGYLVMVPPEDIVDVEYSTEEAFKFIVSFGIVGKDLQPRQGAFASAPASAVPTSLSERDGTQPSPDQCV
jgi:uncharacterized membrane protein